MDDTKDLKRKQDIHSESDDYRKEKRSKKRRSRSRSPRDRPERDSRRKRKRSRSKSPQVSSKQDKRRDDAPNDEVKTAPVRKVKETDMLNTRTGGAYIPPARLRMMQAQITDKSSVAYQRLAWEALKKSIHGHINKINVGNIGIIIKELLKENIVRGRGLLSRSVIQAQAASPTFTNVYAALVAAVNSRFPNIGELLLKRLVIQFKRGFKRNDKPTCISSASFIAHLVNQRVAHEILALELLTLLVETPTDDSVEVAIAFLKECGQKLTEVSSKGVNAIFEMLRNILHEGQLDKRVQYMIEVMFQVWKDGFKDHPAVLEELELVPEEDQFTHLLMLDDATDPQDILNVFKFDDKYEENEQKYKGLSKEILGSDAESEDEEGSGESGSEESDEEEEKEKEVTIIDNTETNLVALRRTIYLTINSSLDFEECAHKLMKMQLKPGQEIELCHMFLDCCAEQRTYEKFYGLLAQRFCNINRIYIGPFEEIFKDSYSTAHRLDTNRLRNVSKFFAHLLFTDSISWEVLECVKLNEEDTTSSSRIYIKILFQELAEYMGLKKLNDRLKDPTLQEAFSGVFPRDNPKNTRFSINFFTSIGLGGLTDELREHLKQMPKNIPPPITEIKLDSDSSSDSSSSSSSDSSSSSSDSSSSDSDEEDKQKEKKRKKKNKNKTPKTPEPEQATDKEGEKVERWGHDGFYETYGADARRKDSRSHREKNDYTQSRNGDERQRDFGRQNDRERTDGGRRREERRYRDAGDNRNDENTDTRRNRNYDQNIDRRRNTNNDENTDYRRNRNNDEEFDRRRNKDDYEDRRRNKNYEEEVDKRRNKNQDEIEDRRRNKNNDDDDDRRRNRNNDENEDRKRNRNNDEYEEKRKIRNIDESEDRRKNRNNDDDIDTRRNRNKDEGEERRRNKNNDQDEGRRKNRNNDEDEDRRRNRNNDEDVDRRRNRNNDEGEEKRRNRNNDEDEERMKKRNKDKDEDRRRNRSNNEGEERRRNRNNDEDIDRMRNRNNDEDEARRRNRNNDEGEERRRNRNNDEDEDRRKTKKNDEDVDRRRNKNYDENCDSGRNKKNIEDAADKRKDKYDEEMNRRNSGREYRDYRDERGTENRQRESITNKTRDRYYDFEQNDQQYSRNKNNKDDEDRNIRGSDRNNKKDKDSDKHKNKHTEKVDKNENLSSSEEDDKNQRQEKNKKEKKKDSKKSKPDDKNKKRGKEKKRSKENVQSSSSSDSESDSSTSSSSSSSDSDSDSKSSGKNDLGGRYWDSFDIPTKKTVESKEKFEGRTPEKSEKNYERRRER